MPKKILHLGENDLNRVKSSSYLYYRIRSIIIPIQKKYNEFNISLVDSPNLIINNNINLQKTVICLIDDFVGTGKTAESAICYFENNNIKRKNIAIVSLVSMNQGLLYLQNIDVKVYTDIKCDKGISSNCDHSKVEIMESIENKIKISDKYRFGFGQSEALVKLIRTPNNTFPIYWYFNKKYNKYAPFPR